MTHPEYEASRRGDVRKKRPGGGWRAPILFGGRGFKKQKKHTRPRTPGPPVHDPVRA